MVICAFSLFLFVSGDVVLKNLDLKESALDELDLPVKIRAGHIANLTLKIPWKNLYTEPVVASIDGLYALAIPNIGIKYNEEKEEKAKQEAKQKKLQQIEDAKKLEAEKDKPKEEKKDSFVEKLATQVIKNLQVQVNNVHVRFEDRFTDPQHPFAIGVTLQELSFKTTDENWNPCVVKDAVTQIFKLVKLESLALYWNSNTTMLDTVPKEEIMLNLKNNVITPQHKPDYQYLIRPISSVAHLRLNTKPDATNFSIPKILLTIVFDDITVALAKLQYNDILQLLEGFERLELLSIYRKYRPDVPRKGNASTWWHFAYKSVLEETVRRRRRMWSWEHISHHRRTMKQYRQAYIQKLDQKKISAETQKKLEEGEKTLDVFSITIMRQQAEVEAAKLGAKRKEEGGGGWFGGLFGGKKKKAAKEENQIQNQLKEAYTAEEKAKLYAAIGYQENEGDITLPKEFVAVRVVTKLNTVCLAIRDAKDSQIMKVQLTDVFTSFSQRPAASAVKVEAKMDKMTVFGSPQSGITPKMVLSQTKEANKVYSLVDLLFETNPLDGACDTRINVNARPVEIIYDAVTVNSLADFFKPPEEVYLKQLSQAAMAKFEEIKEQSATGLQYAIEQRKFTAINVDLKPSCVIVPHKGFYKSDVAVLVLDLGNLKINSEKNKSQAPKERVSSAGSDSKSCQHVPWFSHGR
ncbi:intermembrane lipid transfer protein VPS13C-like [Liolophura sinensis]|uniref:intermembrane lipid transfer protein VPS13C-like n=1 Tax=Liolophura sinensis TaxID=3198878 RepID=UPI0031583DB7